MGDDWFNFPNWSLPIQKIVKKGVDFSMRPNLKMASFARTLCSLVEASLQPLNFAPE